MCMQYIYIYIYIYVIDPLHVRRRAVDSVHIFLSPGAGPGVINFLYLPFDMKKDLVK